MSICVTSCGPDGMKTEEQVIFNVPTNISAESELTIDYVLAGTCTPLDWIGIFHSKFEDTSQPLIYQDAPNKPRDPGIPSKRTVTFTAKQIQSLFLNKGSYQVAYISKDKKVLGASCSFVLSHQMDKVGGQNSPKVSDSWTDSPLMLTSEDEWELASPSIKETSLSDMSDIVVLSHCPSNENIKQNVLELFDHSGSLEPLARESQVICDGQGKKDISREEEQICAGSLITEQREKAEWKKVGNKKRKIQKVKASKQYYDSCNLPQTQVSVQPLDVPPVPGASVKCEEQGDNSCKDVTPKPQSVADTLEVRDKQEVKEAQGFSLGGIMASRTLSPEVYCDCLDNKTGYDGDTSGQQEKDRKHKKVRRGKKIGNEKSKTGKQSEVQHSIDITALTVTELALKTETKYPTMIAETNQPTTISETKDTILKTETKEIKSDTISSPAKRSDDSRIDQSPSRKSSRRKSKKYVSKGSEDMSPIKTNLIQVITLAHDDDFGFAVSGNGDVKNKAALNTDTKAKLKVRRRRRKEASHVLNENIPPSSPEKPENRMIAEPEKSVSKRGAFKELEQKQDKGWQSVGDDTKDSAQMVLDPQVQFEGCRKPKSKDTTKVQPEKKQKQIMYLDIEPVVTVEKEVSPPPEENETKTMSSFMLEDTTDDGFPSLRVRDVTKRPAPQNITRNTSCNPAPQGTTWNTCSATENASINPSIKPLTLYVKPTSATAKVDSALNDVRKHVKAVDESDEPPAATEDTEHSKNHKSFLSQNADASVPPLPIQILDRSLKDATVSKRTLSRTEARSKIMEQKRMKFLQKRRERKHKNFCADMKLNSTQIKKLFQFSDDMSAHDDSDVCLSTAESSWLLHEPAANGTCTLSGDEQPLINFTENVFSLREPETKTDLEQMCTTTRRQIEDDPTPKVLFEKLAQKFRTEPVKEACHAKSKVDTTKFHEPQEKPTDIDVSESELSPISFLDIFKSETASKSSTQSSNYFTFGEKPETKFINSIPQEVPKNKFTFDTSQEEPKTKFSFCMPHEKPKTKFTLNFSLENSKICFPQEVNKHIFVFDKEEKETEKPSKVAQEKTVLQQENPSVFMFGKSMALTGSLPNHGVVNSGPIAKGVSASVFVFGQSKSQALSQSDHRNDDLVTAGKSQSKSQVETAMPLPSNSKKDQENLHQGKPSSNNFIATKTAELPRSYASVLKTNSASSDPVTISTCDDSIGSRLPDEKITCCVKKDSCNNQRGHPTTPMKIRITTNNVGIECEDQLNGASVFSANVGKLKDDTQKEKDADSNLVRSSQLCSSKWHKSTSLNKAARIMKSRARLSGLNSFAWPLDSLDFQLDESQLLTLSKDTAVSRDSTSEQAQIHIGSKHHCSQLSNFSSNSDTHGGVCETLNRSSLFSKDQLKEKMDFVENLKPEKKVNGLSLKMAGKLDDIMTCHRNKGHLLRHVKLQRMVRMLQRQLKENSIELQTMKREMSEMKTLMQVRKAGYGQCSESKSVTSENPCIETHDEFSLRPPQLTPLDLNTHHVDHVCPSLCRGLNPGYKAPSCLAPRSCEWSHGFTTPKFTHSPGSFITGGLSTSSFKCLSGLKESQGHGLEAACFASHQCKIQPQQISGRFEPQPLVSPLNQAGIYCQCYDKQNILTQCHNSSFRWATGNIESSPSSSHCCKTMDSGRKLSGHDHTDDSSMLYLNKYLTTDCSAQPRLCHGKTSTADKGYILADTFSSPTPEFENPEVDAETGYDSRHELYGGKFQSNFMKKLVKDEKNKQLHKKLNSADPDIFDLVKLQDYFLKNKLKPEHNEQRTGGSDPNNLSQENGPAQSMESYLRNDRNTTRSDCTFSHKNPQLICTPTYKPFAGNSDAHDWSTALPIENLTTHCNHYKRLIEALTADAEIDH